MSDLLLPAPRLRDPASVPALSWGSIGAGGIAKDFVAALHRHTDQRMVAVAARDRARTGAFAQALGIERAYVSADELVADPAVDIVYVSTPHSAHREMALKAIAAGKHVLVEKPLAMSAAEAQDIVDAARAAGVFAAEAMWTRYLPQSGILRELLAEGAIGEVDLVTADFGFIAPLDPEGRMWNPALGGGALLDAGVYPISFASSVLGAPARVVAAGTLGSTGVDESVAVELTTKEGQNALIATSIISSLPVRASVIGRRGRIEIIPPFFGPTGIALTLGSIGGERTATWRDERFATLREGLSDQATAIAGYIGERRTESPVHPLDEVVQIMATIDEARRQVARG